MVAPPPAGPSKKLTRHKRNQANQIRILPVLK